MKVYEETIKKEYKWIWILTTILLVLSIVIQVMFLSKKRDPLLSEAQTNAQLGVTDLGLEKLDELDEVYANNKYPLEEFLGTLDRQKLRE